MVANRAVPYYDLGAASNVLHPERVGSLSRLAYWCIVSDPNLRIRGALRTAVHSGLACTGCTTQRVRLYGRIYRDEL